MPAEAYYRQFLDLSQRMLVAGMAQQWDELVRLEQQRSRLLDKAPSLTQSDSRQPIIELIQKIQVCDAELREKIDAWMTDARILLRLDSQHSPKP